MRELVYLSQRKLKQFALNRRRPFRHIVETEVKIPAVGGVKLTNEPSAQDLGALEQVIRALDRSDRAPSWFDDADIQAGQWIHVEAPMSYRLLDNQQPRSPVVFADRPTATRNYPTGGALRILLHGSQEHLLDRAPEHIADQAEATAVRHMGSNQEFLDLLPARPSLVRDFASELVKAAASAEESEEAAADQEDLDDLEQKTTSFLHQFDAEVPVQTAVWMAGYARVTAILGYDKPEHRIVIATPLYVQYVTSPPPERPGKRARQN